VQLQVAVTVFNRTVCAHIAGNRGLQQLGERGIGRAREFQGVIAFPREDGGLRAHLRFRTGPGLQHHHQPADQPPQQSSTRHQRCRPFLRENGWIKPGGGEELGQRIVAIPARGH